MAKTNQLERGYLTRSAQAIRAGRMPEWHQVVTEGDAGR
jgi:hypothetical protein